MNIFLLVCVAISLIIGGGYYLSASGLLSILLAAGIVATVFKNKKMKLQWDLFSLAMLIVWGSFFIVIPWAVDRNMASIGGIKFLPAVLFVILISQLEDEKRKWLIEAVPYLGGVTVILSGIMVLIPRFRDYTIVSGRLGGVFQYPNTMAMFLLVALILGCYQLKDKLNKLLIVDLIIVVAGIIFTQSLSVIILTGIFALYFVFKLIKEKKNIKIAIISLAVIAVIGVAMVFALLILFDMKFKGSTFIGRLLYYQDALKVIVKNPFGLGYYGYLFAQGNFQTGVYSVTNVHNDFLQLILDVGVLPGFVMIFATIRQVFFKKQDENCKVAMVFMLIHGAFDFDFQFISIIFIFLLMLKPQKQVEFNIPSVARDIVVIFFVSIFYFAGKVGLSDAMFSAGDYENASKMCQQNTFIKIHWMQKQTNIKDANKIADEILKVNSSVGVVYDVKAEYIMGTGDIEKYVEYRELSIEKNPFKEDRYYTYVHELKACADLYIQYDDMESATYCIYKMQTIPEKLKALENKTSTLGWKIKDKPVTALNGYYQSILDEYLEMIER